MNAFDGIKESVKKIFESERRFVQYMHFSSEHTPCEKCSSNFNRIFEKGTEPKVPVHPNCDCFYIDVPVMRAGTVSALEQDGPDWWLKYKGRLPDNYITKEEAKRLGWIKGRNTLHGKAPGKMIGGDIFVNENKILPVKPGRIWYECDVDYFEGKRESKRLVYSNDGLIFYTPDHYKTYYYVEKREKENERNNI